MNHGAELHHMQILRLEQGKTMADFSAAMESKGPPPAWISFLGGPQGGLPHGPATNVTVTLTPGNYVVLCFIPSPDGKPHVAKGMVKPLTVTRATAVAQAGAPKADYVLTLYDYNFETDKPLKAGRRTILIKNTAKQFHEAVFAKLPPNTDYRVSVVNSPGKGVYPISSFTWILAYGKQADAEKGKKLTDFLRWALSEEGQAMAPPLDYAPLPEAMRSALVAKLDSIQ